MIEFLSMWAKGLGLAIVIVSILEMLLPNNKSKKYIRMVMGIYVVFSIISPFVSNKEIFAISNFDIEKYTNQSKEYNMETDQTSMNEKIEKLYIEEIKKDMKDKIEQRGYIVENILIKANIQKSEEKSRITQVKLIIKKTNNNIKEIEKENLEIEEKLVDKIKKIKPVDISTTDKKTQKKIDKDIKTNENNKITKSDIQNIKKFLIDEYGVSEKCLEIN